MPREPVAMIRVPPDATQAELQAMATAIVRALAAPPKREIETGQPGLSVESRSLRRVATKPD